MSQDSRDSWSELLTMPPISYEQRQQEIDWRNEMNLRAWWLLKRIDPLGDGKDYFE